MSERVIPNRAAVRELVNRHFPRLVAAAADGVLPQFRLDLEDEIEAEFGTLDDAQREKLMSMLRQEIDAALQQNRLNPTVVTQAVDVTPNVLVLAIRWLLSAAGVAFSIICLIAAGNVLQRKEGGVAFVLFCFVIFLLWLSWALAPKSRSPE